MIETMYPAAVNSRQTELATDIDDTQTSFTVLDGSVLPPAPNQLVLDPANENAETILYTEKTGNVLTGVTRAFEGVAQSWGAGTRVARFFSAYDHNTFKANIEDLNRRLENIPAPQDASLTDKGIVQLSKSTTGERDTIAATESAVGAVQGQVGNLAELQTTDKDNLVDALNEVFTHVGDGKNLIKSAVIVKGGTVAGTSPHSFAELADGIGTIETATVINGQEKRKVTYAESINSNDPIYANTAIGDIVDLPDRPPGSYSRSVAYSKDGKYVAFGLGASPFVAIYKITNGEYTRLPDPAVLPTGDAYSAAFSPEGDLVIGHANTPYITIFKRIGDTFTKIANPAVLPSGTSTCIAFSPDGVYWAIGHSGGNLLTVYKRSGDTFTRITVTGHPSTVNGVAFSPDGTYLALAHVSTPFMTIFKRNGDTFTKLSNPDSLPVSNGRAVCFASDGILIVAYEGSPYISLYSRSGDVFTKMSDLSGAVMTRPDGVALSPEGDVLGIAHAGYPFFTTYLRQGVSFTKMTAPAILPVANAFSVAFSPDGMRVALASNSSGGSRFITMYKRTLQAFKSNNSLTDVKSANSLGYALESGIAGEEKDAIIIWR
ncbi:tail fiber protein [Paenibacillus sp. FSL R5-0519]|uniref:tail fiber protein n=1 Tax=Paenibacillus sp. FSL R5-0519 TaxID=2921648 RepID=UPI0030D6FCE2